MCTFHNANYLCHFLYFRLTLGLLIVACIICCGYLRKKNNQRRESTGVIVYSAQSNAVNYLPNETAATYSTTNTTHYMTSAPAYSTTHYVTSPPVYRETVTTLRKFWSDKSIIQNNSCEHQKNLKILQSRQILVHVFIKKQEILQEYTYMQIQ